ncbi:DEAD/DEAH box helicase family protein [Candidatus Pacearchaeota archaeon]|nr:DEAD/DEAH box helicase family protein [Candidatus Pacearchaeota archaeon]
MPNIINLNPRDYQKAILETAKNSNTLVVLPTGLGKTLIALLLSIERIKKYPTSKVLFLAPTKPLVEQHFETYKAQLPELYAQLDLFTGTVPAEKRKKLFQTAEIVFSTPQCIANDLDNHLYDLKEVSLLIIDEAHRCLKNYDYTKAVKNYKEQSHHPLILGLTASPGHDPKKVEEICKHLNINEIELRTRDSEDVKPYLKEREFDKIDVPFPPEFQEIRILLKRIFDSRVEILRTKNILFGPANKIALLKLQTRLGMQVSQKNWQAMHGLSLCAQAIKISHAQELLETQTLSGLNDYLNKMIQDSNEKKSRAVQTLVSLPEFNAARISLQHLLANKIEHPKLSKLKELVEQEFKDNENSKIIVFAHFRETGQTISNLLNQNPKIKSSIFIGQAKKLSRGISTGLNQKEQKAIIDKFKNDELNVLVATSIGEEGLDIPEVSAVIFYEPIPSAIRKIQRAGRTARLMPGKLIILVTQDSRDEIHHYASNAREKKMYKTIEEVRKNLKLKSKNPTLDKFK